MIHRRSLLQGAAAAALAATPLRPAAAAGEPIRIGHQCDLTGALASTGYWRRKTTDAAAKWVNENGGIAGRPVEIVTIDTETKVDTGVLRLRQLIQDKQVDFVVGSQNGGVALASNPLCLEFATLCLSLSRTDEVTGSGANPYIFRLIVNTALTSKAAGPWMVDTAGKSWTTLYADYVWGMANRDSWHAEVAAKNGTVGAEVAMPVNTTDPLPYLSKLSHEAGAVFISVLGPDMPRVLPALRQIGFASKTLVTVDSSFGNSDLLALRKQSEGVWGMDSLPWELADKDTPNTRLFRTSIGVDEHGRETGTNRLCGFGDAWPCWSNLGLLKKTIEGSGWKTKADTPALIRYAQANPDYAEGPLFPQGPLFVRPDDHQAFGDYFIMRIENGGYHVKHQLPKEAGMYPATAHVHI
jgi:branched-chain amino acid transport system substrate-binding protein